VLILAAGLVQAFRDFDWTAGTIGYVVMRASQICLWLRAGHADSDRRPSTRRYAVGIGLVQTGWLARLALPHTLGWTLASFALLAAAELAVPALAERAGRTAWHPHHIAERYGLFTLILLGELVAVAVAGVQVELDSTGLTPGLTGVSASSLVLLLALWWLYFMSPMAEHLERQRELAFPWGYGHASIFLALAVLGAGLELAVEVSHRNHLHVELVAVGYLICAPVAVFVIGLWALQAWAARSPRGWPEVGLVVAVLLGSPWLALTGFGVAGAVAASAVAAVGLTALVMVRATAQGRTATDHEDLVDC
ncbi:MAG: low temperature requirement protein A, partial [Bifidobacteriaceae bacterium]|jgi:low temperature requirement protein LtrA|nr:low temperature requirement protein A [Bifidobacteriaceae bacterium]